jgi:hypothetical protein
MSNRSWFFASQGQQRGPYPEAELRELIARGTVAADTLVWSEGMTGWQKAGDIPGLLSGASGPPAMRRPGGALMDAGGDSGGSLSLDFGIWEYIWRTLVVLFSLLFVIPAPWAMLMYCRWIVSCVHVPQRPNLAFTGRLVDLMWFYAFVLLIVVAAVTQSQILSFAINIGTLVLYWVLLRWFIANLSSNGQPLGLRFSGSIWGFVGYSLLVVISVITIIGWAWAYAAQIRWMCRHIEGTRREVVFNGTGLEFLWRSILVVLSFIFIIPVPWMYRWFARWLASQTVLVERGTMAGE